ncbi:MAG TPA: M48 family metallopeptidase [Terriglobales bacterium]|nr:M48 family metallopeptidase [Terriglobales bacterium]
MRHNALSRILAVILVFGITVPSWAQAMVPLPKPGGSNFFSPEQDVELGKQNAAEVKKQMPLLPDSSPITQYVQSIGKKLANTMPQPNWPYEFHVVQQKDINAFALPGGPIFVNLGTIQAADNEAQLAGVIAHEMSHVYYRHSTNQASKQMMAQVPLAILGGMLGNGVMGQVARLGLSFGVGSVFLKYSRSAESQADAVGARILYNAGYNPVEMANFFRKLEQESGGGGAAGPQFLSDHPNPGNRVTAVSKEVSQFPRKSFAGSSSEFNRIHQQAANVKGYSAQEIQQRAQGQASTVSDAGIGAVQPSGSMQSLNHGAYTVSYPSNWKVFGNQESAVTIAPEAGISQDAVAYGVIINGFQPESSTMRDATNELVASLKQSNPDLRTVNSGDDIRVNGTTGRSVDLTGTSPIQDSSGKKLRERDWLVTMPRKDGTVLYFVFISPERDFSKLRPTFEQMLRSVKLK